MQKKDDYRVCLIGALADISGHHLEAIRSVPRFTLAAVCDIDKARLRQKYPEIPEGSLFSDLNEALNSGDFDIAVITTPNKLHSEMSIAALKAGKAVLCEKPMTHSLVSANRLYKAVKVSSGIFVVSYHFGFFPEVRQFARERDKFGALTGFSFTSSEYLDGGKPWNLDGTQGGPWLDWAPNALSVLHVVLSSNDLFDSFSIKNAGFVRPEGYGIELKAGVDLVLDGISGKISVDWMAPENCFIANTVLRNVKGDEITLDHASCKIFVNGNEYWSGEDRRYINLYQDFLSRLENGSSNIEIGMQDMRIIQAVRDVQKIHSPAALSGR